MDLSHEKDLLSVIDDKVTDVRLALKTQEHAPVCRVCVIALERVAVLIEGLGKNIKQKELGFKTEN